MINGVRRVIDNNNIDVGPENSAQEGVLATSDSNRHVAVVRVQHLQPEQAQRLPQPRGHRQHPPQSLPALQRQRHALQGQEGQPACLHGWMRWRLSPLPKQVSTRDEGSPANSCRLDCLNGETML